MRVDEAGRDDVTRCVDRISARDRLLGNRDDAAILDADIAYRVELGLRVHDPAVEDDEVVAVLAIGRTGDEKGGENDG